MPKEYSLSDALERMYQNQLVLEAAIWELALQIEAHRHADLKIMGVTHWRQLAQTPAESSKVWRASPSYHDLAAI